ncbi:MAG: hypothetical protein DHS20C10_03610 [marine bacterium B5-7]|nr:MAG: hypothetical protein DHS20C10_03610 [marine bacterium B5-7]
MTNKKALRTDDYLAHMLEAIRRIDEYVTDLDEVSFINSTLAQDVAGESATVDEASSSEEKKPRLSPSQLEPNQTAITDQNLERMEAQFESRGEEFQAFFSSFVDGYVADAAPPEETADKQTMTPK